jgi:hypothetical protein
MPTDQTPHNDCKFKWITEHDLRSKCASDATSLEHARALLSHADSRAADEFCRRKPEVVKPLGSVS